jgi:hypothetical protein
MRTRHRHRSEEITFSAKVAGVLQRSYGIPLAPGIDSTRVFETAFQSLTSQYPLHARFLETVAFVPGGG